MDKENVRITWDTPISELIHSERDDNIAYIDLDEGELMHWKYIKREKLPNGKWRYYYDKDALKNDVKAATNSVRNKFSSIFNKQAKTSKTTVGKKTGAKTTGGLFSGLKKLGNKVEQAVKRAKKTVHKYIAKVPTEGGTYRYFYSDKAYRAYLNGKNAVDKAIDKAGDKKIGHLIDDYLKDTASKFTSTLMNTGFGKAIYNLALPAFTALQVAIQTPKSIDDMKKIDGEQTNKEHQEAINPDYDPTKFDYAYNCSFCTAAYDLRKRGYDVEAMSISVLEGPVIDDILSWYDGAVAVSEKSVKATVPNDEPYNNAKRAATLEKSLETYGDGARGHLAVYWTYGGGHDIAWEIENGKAVFRDCQTNEVYDISEVLPYVNDYSFVRVDNCDITEEVLRTVRNRD